MISIENVQDLPSTPAELALAELASNLLGYVRPVGSRI
jgi:hypothetical protein